MTNNYNSKITGQRVANLRKENGLTQDKLAQKLKVDTSLIGHYERGRNIPIDKLYKIAEYFNTSTDYLLGLTDSKSCKISDISICNRTGLKNKQVKILEMLKGTEIIETINYLIEQEEDVLLGSVPPPIEATHLKQIQYENAKQNYYKELERIENNCNPILRTIHNYLSIKATKEDIYIMPNGDIKKLNDFKYKVDRYLADATINTNEIIEKTFLEKIEKQLKNAKTKFKKGETKN